MSLPPRTPPKTPQITTKMTVQSGNPDTEMKSRPNGSQKAEDEPIAKPVSLVIRETSDRNPVPSSEPTQDSDAMEGSERAEPAINPKSEENSANSRDLEPFNWEEFEARYDEAMSKANETEAALLKVFHDTTVYFSIWAVSAAQNDDERAMKRLKTREAYIKQAERSLEEKRRHYVQVVEAFKKALELLTGQ